jgi:hypothetical protein
MAAITIRRIQLILARIRGSYAATLFAMEGFNVTMFEAVKSPQYSLAVSLLHTYAEHLVR